MTRKKKTKTLDYGMFFNIAELRELLTTVKLPTPHPDANFPKKPPSRPNPTFGCLKTVKPPFDYKTLNPPPPRVEKKINACVYYRCEACQFYFNTKSQHADHVLKKINAHETGDGLLDAPTFVFANNAPIGMEYIEKTVKECYYCSLCKVGGMKLEPLISHVNGQRHWNCCKKLDYYGENPVKIIYPSMYINEVAGYLDSFPFADSVKELALSKPPVPTFDEIFLADVEISHTADITKLAAKKALFDFLDEGLQSVGSEYLKKYSRKDCEKVQWYCEVCNCRLVQDATKRDRDAHYKSRQHRVAWAKEKQEKKIFKQNLYALKNFVSHKFEETSDKENFNEEASAVNDVPATQNDFSSLCDEFSKMSLS